MAVSRQDLGKAAFWRDGDVRRGGLGDVSFVARSNFSLTLIAVASVPAVLALALVGLHAGSMCPAAGLADSCEYTHTDLQKSDVFLSNYLKTVCLVCS